LIDRYKKLGFVWLGLFIVMSILFRDIWHSLTTSFALFFLFVLPGFSILYKKEFIERLVFGSIIGMAMIGLPSYYLGVLGFHVKYHFVFAIIITTIGIGLEHMYTPEVEPSESAM
jgi:hypothetical protein